MTMKVCHYNTAAHHSTLPCVFLIEPRIEFINNTPDSTGFNISSEFQIEGCINQTMCTVRQTGESIACEPLCLFHFHVLKCLSLLGENSVSFTQERNGARTLFITASGVCGNSQTLSRILRSGEPMVVYIQGNVDSCGFSHNRRPSM